MCDILTGSRCRSLLSPHRHETADKSRCSSAHDATWTRLDPLVSSSQGPAKGPNEPSSFSSGVDDRDDRGENNCRRLHKSLAPLPSRMCAGRGTAMTWSSYGLLRTCC